MMEKKKNGILAILPVLFSFFVMGFVDVVNISTSYVKQDFALNDKVANLLPMMVFLWFAVCSLPVGKVMNRIGRKKTVLLSAVVTTVAMLLPVVSYSFPLILTAFALLGIGNTILQVSLNPLMTNVSDKERLASMLTLGQFIKAISSTLGPVLVSCAVGLFGNWKLIFPTYAFLTIVSMVWLLLTPIHEDNYSADSHQSSLKSLFKDPYIILLFLGIMLSVGFEIGLMTTVPKYLGEKFDMSLDVAGLGCSLYYIARTIGTFLGTIILARVSSKKFLEISVSAGLLSLLAFMFVRGQVAIFVCMFALGLFCANIFAVVFSAALQAHPDMANEVSSLMIMGVAGGALLPPVMGVIADASNQQTSLLVLVVALACILFVAFRINDNKLKVKEL